MIIHIVQSAWPLILLQALLIRSICSSHTISCNMPKLVTIVTLYLMNKRNKRNLFPLKFYKYFMILSWRKGSFKCRCSLRFYFLMLLVLLLDLLLVLLHISFVRTLVDGIIFYKILGFFVIFSCM